LFPEGSNGLYTQLSIRTSDLFSSNRSARLYINRLQVLRVDKAQRSRRFGRFGWQLQHPISSTMRPFYSTPHILYIHKKNSQSDTQIERAEVWITCHPRLGFCCFWATINHGMSNSIRTTNASLDIWLSRRTVSIHHASHISSNWISHTGGRRYGEQGTDAVNIHTLPRVTSTQFRYSVCTLLDHCMCSHLTHEPIGIRHHSTLSECCTCPYHKHLNNLIYIHLANESRRMLSSVFKNKQTWLYIS